MSGLWTPSGEHVPDPDTASGESDLIGESDLSGDAGDQHAVEEELRRVRAEIARTPAADIVANHAIGLWQLAVLHLNPEGGDDPNLAEASVAIDAMGGVVDTLGDRLGEHAGPLREAVSQLRLAFVEIQRQAPGGAG